MEKQLRQKLIDHALQMQQSGLSAGRSGNLSLRYEDDLLITPSALHYHQMAVEDIVLLSLGGENLDPKQTRKPSSEWPFHTAIYKEYPHASAIIHCHSIYATTLSCLGKNIPAFHYMVAIAGGDSIPCSEYATFGSQELAAFAVNALKKSRACLLANHGQIAYNDTIESALELALEVENLAQVYYQALQIGEPTILAKKEMKQVLKNFANYRP